MKLWNLRLYYNFIATFLLILIFFLNLIIDDLYLVKYELTFSFNSSTLVLFKYCMLGLFFNIPCSFSSFWCFLSFPFFCSFYWFIFFWNDFKVKTQLSGHRCDGLVEKCSDRLSFSLTFFLPSQQTAVDSPQ